MNIVREQAMPTEVVVDTGADTSAGLSDRDRQIIAFERQWWKYAGSKESAIKELSLSSEHISKIKQFIFISLLDKKEAAKTPPKHFNCPD